jgi:predicted dehydrogenase
LSGIGIVGCGSVSRVYIPVLTRIPDVEIVRVADLDPGRAQAIVQEYELPTAVDPMQLLDDPVVDIVLNLTPIPVHVEVSKAALAAGKHLYSEKPLADDLTSAIAMVGEARQRGLALACAPDTLLGSGFQAARKALAEGTIGRPLVATAVMLHPQMSRATSHSEGSTPFFDMAPYYVTALVNLFGPAARVTGCTRTAAAGEVPRRPEIGSSIAVTGIVEFVSGITADLALVWGTGYRGEVPMLTVFGSDGVLHLPNPNNFGDPAFVSRHGDDARREVPGSRQSDDLPRNLRGLGVGEMALAIGEGRRPRTDGEIACHVVDIITGLIRSAATGTWMEMTTTCAPAPALPAATRAELLVET